MTAASCDLYRLLDTVRVAERVLPEVRGLAELMWRYSQGVALGADDLVRLDGIIDALRSRGAFSGDRNLRLAGEDSMADTNEQLTIAMRAVEARLTTLEHAPTAPAESADLTTIPTAALIVDAAGAVYTLAGGRCVVNAAPVADTGNVTLMKYVRRPVNPALTRGVYQRNAAGEWYGPVVTTTGGPRVAGDPSQATPAPSPTPTPTPTPGGAPAWAAAVGYNTRTFGPGLVMGQNWQLFDLYGGSAPGCVTQLANGAIRCNGNGPNGFNAHVSTVRAASGSPGWRGVSFGGGAYIEATLSWANAYNPNNGWPSFWGNEASREGYGTRTTNGQKDAIELDLMEWWGEDHYGMAIHRWYQNNQDFHPAIPENTGVSGHVNRRYGCLWVPSTPSSDGYARMYFEGVAIRTSTWPRYDPNAGFPPTSLSAMDVTHQALILGTSSGNPMTVVDVSVWQRDAGQNIVV